VKPNIEKWFGLEGLTAVVAGASGTIGSACAQALYDCGAKVIGFDADVKDNLPGKNIKLDITAASELDKFITGLRDEKGEAWAFINCSYPHTAKWGSLAFENVSADEWNQNVQLHLGSAFYFTQKAVEFLKERGGGSIINFGSIYGLVGPNLEIYSGTNMTNAAPYSAIKAGIIGLSRYVATVYGEKNIRANVVAPGGLKSSQPDSFVKSYEKHTPLRRMGTTEDIAGVVAFLVGPSAKYITGQVIAVDGGWTAW